MDRTNDEFKEGATKRGDAPVASVATPGVTVSVHAARTALRMAEQAVDEINTRLREAEHERDFHARMVGEQQATVQRLTAEREFRTKHVRDLMAATQ